MKNLIFQFAGQCTMSGEILFCFCHIGGQVITKEDGSMGYSGGSSKGIDLNSNMNYTEVVEAVCRLLNISPVSVSMKYSVKFDKSVLLALTDQDALSYLFRYNEGWANIYVYYDEGSSQERDTCRR